MDGNPAFNFHEACYLPQRIPQYQGNPLIEALPAPDTEASLMERLFSMPEFDPVQRDWHTSDRIQMLAQLASFMIPLERHIQLAYCLDALIRQGYRGRIPYSMASTEIFKKLYEQKTQGKLFNVADQVTAQLSSSLVGLPGTGKTTALKRIMGRYPKVIHHPLYGIYQITHLHIETPYDGASVAGLAHSVFRQVDMLLPGANYMQQYAGSSHGAATLMNHAARVLHMHHVGLLIADEIQNLMNSPKNRTALMSLLVSASNELGVPILFAGTPKADNLLAQNLSQARRSSGHGVPRFDRLIKDKDPQKTDEWDVFFGILWRFQWVRKPAEATPFINDLMYRYSQGIIDVAIKLFVASQVRAMMDGSESLTGHLIADVAQSELAKLEPMIDALRRNDPDALNRFDDIGPQSLDTVIAQVQHRYAGRRVAGASVQPGNEQFKPMVSSALEVLGFDPESAEALADGASGATDALAGVQHALATSRSGKRARKDKAPPKPVTYLPGDYRNAFNRPQSVSVFEQMGALKMLPDLDALFAS